MANGLQIVLSTDDHGAYGMFLLYYIFGLVNLTIA
jgi:hypothetical protein